MLLNNFSFRKRKTKYFNLLIVIKSVIFCFMKEVYNKLKVLILECKEDELR